MFLCFLTVGFAVNGGPRAEAGAAKGVLKKVYTVQGFHVRTIKVAFTPDEPAVVTVQGDGDTALRLVVLDARGKRVAGAKAGDKGRVRWTPTSSEPYRIKVYNRGGVPNRFLLRTN
jgi:hypothetical protein